MKHFFTAILTVFLLCGCAAQAPNTETTEAMMPASSGPAAAAPAPAEPVILADGAVTGFPTEGTVTGFMVMENGFLVFTEENSLTTLTLIDPETLTPLYTHEPGFLLMRRNFTVQQTDSGMAYFCGPTRETVMLDSLLREIRRIPAPEDMTGSPLLSADGDTLFYCTNSAIRALDLSSGISRILKEASYPVQGISGLLLEDTIVQVSITDAGGTIRTLFLSVETGQLLGDYEGNLNPQTAGNTYFLNQSEDGLRSILFGDLSGDTMVLQPRGSDGVCTFLPLTRGAVTADWIDRGICLELYDLITGKRMSAVTLPMDLYPQNLVQTEDGSIWFLSAQAATGKSMLCRWDVTATAVHDSSVYGSPYFTKEEPDYEGLAACALYASEIGTKHGIDVLVYKDAVALEPWDYRLEYEYQSTILMQALQQLDKTLGHFPDGILSTLAETFTGLKIAIVRSAVGSPESGSLEAVNGIQFFDGYDAYIVLSTGYDTEYALYHELCHLMETVVLTESTAYDRWDQLNPQNFKYDGDYTANQNRDGSKWLQPGKEYFIDTYAMSYPKEDRARLLEYAMTPGHEALFASPNLQAKLRQLSIGLREGFGLTADQGPFLWEQYLAEPIM